MNPEMEATVATDAEIEAARSLMPLAFCDDPVWRYMYARPQDYLNLSPRLLGAYGEKAFSTGEVRVLRNGQGAALWLSPGTEPDYEEMGRIVSEDVAVERRGGTHAMFEDLVRYTPQDPHWFLTLIGVEPALRGRGGGSALLKATLARCDREGAAAYLTSTKPENVPLYVRLGFEVLGTSQVGNAPPLFPMLRRAR